jgi:hypothetical protein
LLPFDGVLTFVAFYDTTATKLGSTNLFVNQDLSGWDVAEISIRRIQFDPLGPTVTDTLLARGVISVVPEPATGGLLALGLGGVGAWRRGAARRRSA